MAVSRREWLERVGITTLGGVATAGLPACKGDPDAPAPVFLHGVASGDPTTEAVILWTRITPENGETPASIEVTWELARDPEMGDVVAMGTATTGPERDYTVKVDATGLDAATTYYYRFEGLGGRSAVGRTKTAGDVANARFAVMSCSSLAHGFFHAYRYVAENPDLDAVIHLGDYIYEYETGSYGVTREYDPPHEIVTLDDYRRRYRQYRSDPDLQAAHQQHPFIVVWDDHESADNSYRDGAENHQSAEGDWAERLAVAYQTWAEWLPVREQEPGKIWRKLQWGSLLDLLMLDTRIYGRDLQPESSAESTDPTRELLGSDQETWLFSEMSGSSAAWKVLGQQVMFAQWVSDVAEDGPRYFNLDQWDGYQAARDRLLAEMASVDDVVVLTGDIHSAWASELTATPTDPESYDPATGEGSVGVELVATAITSPGFPELIAGPVEMTSREQNPHIKHINLTQRGWIVMDLTAERMQADFYALDGILADEGNAMLDASWSVARGTAHLEMASGPLAMRAEVAALAPDMPGRDHLAPMEEESEG